MTTIIKIQQTVNLVEYEVFTFNQKTQYVLEKNQPFDIVKAGDH